MPPERLTVGERERNTEEKMAAQAGTTHRKSGKKRKCAVYPWFRRNMFVLLLVSSTMSGYLLGVVLQSFWTPSGPTLHLIGFPGQLVLRSFLMILVPLLFCSLVLGVSSLRKGGDTRMVVLTIAFFLLLSSLSAVMGAVAGHVVHPGQKVTSLVTNQEGRLTGRKGLILDSMLDLLWNAIPSNIVESTFIKEYTHVEVVNGSTEMDAGSANSSIIYKKTLKQAKGVNFMGLLTFSIFFGCALAALGEKGQQLHQIIEQLNAAITRILRYFLNLLPLGMFSWMLREGLESRAPVQLLGHLGLFLATALGCMALHQFLILPLLYFALVRKNPLRYHLNLLPAILTAFGTASSAATLPLTVRCAEESNRLNKCVTSFVLPLGMVVHMNGPTLYMPLSSLFLAQLEGIEMGMVETIVMCITTVILFVSAPGIPSGGNPVYLLTVMAAGGISRPQFISVFLSMEWLMERFRTVMNVVGDSYVAAFVDKLCSSRLPSDESGRGQPPTVLRELDPDAIQRRVCRSCGSTVEILDV